jgi:hypothetical protein
VKVTDYLMGKLPPSYRLSRAFLDRAIFGPTSAFGEFDEFFSRPEYPY